jgi:hypothetical protein
MRRREIIGLFGGAAMAWPINAPAQQPKIARIGVLYIRTADAEDMKQATRDIPIVVIKKRAPLKLVERLNRLRPLSGNAVRKVTPHVSLM